MEHTTLISAAMLLTLRRRIVVRSSLCQNDCIYPDLCQTTPYMLSCVLALLGIPWAQRSMDDIR